MLTKKSNPNMRCTCPSNLQFLSWLNQGLYLPGLNQVGIIAKCAIRCEGGAYHIAECNSMRDSSPVYISLVKIMVLHRNWTCRGRLPHVKRSYGAKWRTANQIAERPFVSQSRGRAGNSLWGGDCPESGCIWKPLLISLFPRQRNSTKNGRCSTANPAEDKLRN